MSQVSRRELLVAGAAVTAGALASSTPASAGGGAARQNTSATGIKSGYVETEGDRIYYEVQGKGRPLLMISGGNADAGFYSTVAPILADEYQVISYDRRGSSRSSRNLPQNPEMSQQARDAVAVMRAVGHKKALVFGNSGGALIALEMAALLPQYIEAAVVHEPPAIGVLPDAAKWRVFYAEVHLTAMRDGWEKARNLFYSSLVLPSDLYKYIPRDFAERLQKYGNSEFLMNREFICLTQYEPRLDRIKANGVKIALAAGEKSLEGKAHYALTAPIIAERLGCPMVVMPGYHNSYWDMAEPWAASLRKTLHSF